MSPAARLTGFGVTIDSRHRGAESVTVLGGVDLTVGAGAVTALVGESGCGKSLVALALCGLLPAGSITTGELLIGDRTVRGEAQWRAVRGHEVALVPQSPATSFTPVRRLGPQLDEVVRVLGGSDTSADLLDRAHLPRSAASLFPHELSGGMAQRAAIAAALAASPSLVVADEPTSALDPALAQQVWALLGEIADSGRAVLVITHDLTSLIDSHICSSIAVLRAGRTVVQGPTADVVASSDPYVGRLFAEVTA